MSTTAHNNSIILYLNQSFKKMFLSFVHAIKHSRTYIKFCSFGITILSIPLVYDHCRELDLVPLYAELKSSTVVVQIYYDRNCI